VVDINHRSDRDLLIGLGIEINQVAKKIEKHDQVLFDGDENNPSVVETVRTVQNYTQFFSSFRRLASGILAAVVTGVLLQFLQFRRTNEGITEARVAAEAAVESAAEVKEATETVAEKIAATAEKVDDVVETQGEVAKLIEKKVKPPPPKVIRVPAKAAPAPPPPKKPKRDGWFD